MKFWLEARSGGKKTGGKGQKKREDWRSEGEKGGEDAVRGEKTLSRLIKTNVLWVRLIMFGEGWCGEFSTAGEHYSTVSQQMKRGWMQ